jgi:hypothetical protein
MQRKNSQRARSIAAETLGLRRMPTAQKQRNRWLILAVPWL